MSTKKILAVLLALFVLATAVSGCGNSGSSSADSQSGSSATSENSASTEDTASTDGEVPTISLMVVCGTTPPDADAVAEKLSEITREKIGCNVEFMQIDGIRIIGDPEMPVERVAIVGHFFGTDWDRQNIQLIEK